MSLQKWKMPWHEIDVLIAGHSAIDLPRIRAFSIEDAEVYLRNYGYDYRIESRRKRLHAIFIEALHFIQHHLFEEKDKSSVPIPDEITQLTDLRQLLVWASDESEDKLRQYRQVWACAILRVSHTIVHLAGMQKHISVEHAREQITSRFKDYLWRDKDGSIRLGEGDFSVTVASVEWKNKKTRASIILKLLHKRANVAETLYDFLGMRIVTQSITDALLVVRLLRKHYMITLVNVVPHRCRNTLIDVSKFKIFIENLFVKHRKKELTEAEFEATISKKANEFKPQKTSGSKSNEHSAKTYHSIQLTCRQLIRYKNSWVKSLETLIGARDPEILRIMKKSTPIEEEAFFPFEIQIFDENSFKETKKGSSSHERYKESQIKAARRRVLAPVFRAARRMV